MAEQQTDIDLTALDREVDRDGRAAWRAELEHQLARIQEARR